MPKQQIHNAKTVIGCPHWTWQSDYCKSICPWCQKQCRGRLCGVRQKLNVAWVYWWGFVASCHI